MGKNSYLIIVLIGILIATGIVFLNTYAQPEGTIKVGDVYFGIPEGYHEGTLNQLGDVNLTNGTNSIFIKKHDSGDLYKKIKEYEEYKKTENTTVTVSNFKINDELVYKTVSDHDANVNHYWFLKNNKVYSIYSLQKNEDIDKIATNMIKTAKC